MISQQGDAVAQGTCSCDRKPQWGSGKVGWTGRAVERLSIELGDGYSVLPGSHCPQQGETVSQQDPTVLSTL